MKHLFIINPTAGGGRTLNFIPQIEKIFAKNGQPYKIELTNGPGDAKKIAEKYTSNINGENLRIYSVGGDGTLNEVLNGMIGTSSSLAVIPLGTGNDFMRSIAPRYNIKNILINTIEGEEKFIDCAKVNEKYFLNISSVGFDAEIMYNSEEYKKSIFLPGKLAYIYGIFATLFKYKDKKISIDVDGEKIDDTKVLLVAIANGKCYGGGITVSPYSKLDDGKLNISFIKSIKASQILKPLIKFVRGKYEDIKEIKFLTGKKIEIKCDKIIKMSIDGEIFESDQATFEILPNKVKFVIPNIEGVSKTVSSVESPITHSQKLDI